MIVDFKSKKIKKKNITNGVLAFVISESLQKIEPKNCTLQERSNWYRELLGIDNLLFFSENKDDNENITGYSLIILDITKDEYDQNITELNFAENGRTGRYTVPFIDVNSVPLGLIFNFKEIINKIKKEKK